MRVRVLFLFLFCAVGNAASHISVGYFDKTLYAGRTPKMPIEMLEPAKSYERGGFLMAKSSVGEFLFLHINGGGNYGYWKEANRTTQTTSSFLSLEVPILSLFGVRLFLEGSIFGPSYLFEKRDKISQKRFAYQQFLTLGLSIGRMQGLTLELSIFQYTGMQNIFDDSLLTTPLLLSTGITF